MANYKVIRGVNPIEVLTSMNLADRERQMRLQDEARRRAELMSDREKQRSYDKEVRTENREFEKEMVEDERLERAVQRVEERNLKVDDARSALYQATGFDDVDPRSGTLSDDKKAIKLGSKKLKALLQQDAQEAEEIEKLLSADDKTIGARVLSRLAGDPEVVSNLSEKQLAGLQNGTLSLMDVMKALPEKKRSILAGRYNEILADTAEQSQNQSLQKAAARMRQRQSRQNSLQSAIYLMQRALPPGAVADAFEEVPPPTTAQRAATDPVEAFVGQFAGPAATAPSAPAGVPSPPKDYGLVGNAARSYLDIVSSRRNPVVALADGTQRVYRNYAQAVGDSLFGEAMPNIAPSPGVPQTATPAPRSHLGRYID